MTVYAQLQKIAPGIRSTSTGKQVPVCVWKEHESPRSFHRGTGFFFSSSLFPPLSSFFSPLSAVMNGLDIGRMCLFFPGSVRVCV